MTRDLVTADVSPLTPRIRITAIVTSEVAGIFLWALLWAFGLKETPYRADAPRSLVLLYCLRLQW